MNRFTEMIQMGEDLIARTKTLLDNEIDLTTSGSVDIATYLSDLKAIHSESLDFTNPDVAESLEQYRVGMTNEEYMEHLTQYLTIRGQILGELRDRLYDKTAKVDMAFNAKTAEYNALNEEISTLKADIESIKADIAHLDVTIEILNRSNNEAAVGAIVQAKNNMLARIAEKEARIEQIKQEQHVLLHGVPAAQQENDHENENNHTDNNEGNNTPEENQDQEDEHERAPLPQEDEDDIEEEAERDNNQQQDGQGFVPVFPDLDQDDEEQEQEAQDQQDREQQDEREPLPQEEAEDQDLEPLPEEDDVEEEEEEEEQLDPIPNDEDEQEVIHHTDAKPTLLRKIGNIVYAVVAFLSMAHLGVHVAEHGISLDHEPALEQESQLDEEDLEEVPNQTEDDEEETQDQEQNQDDNQEQEDDEVVDTPNDVTPDDDNKEDEEQEETNEEEEIPALSALPAELSPLEYIVDNQTGLEVTSTGDAYVHTEDGVTLDDGQRELTATDNGTVIVGQEDMQTDQKLPELTGNEVTYEEATADMTAQEISELDAALAEWASQFDTGLTLKP